MPAPKLPKTTQPQLVSAGLAAVGLLCQLLHLPAQAQANAKEIAIYGFSIAGADAAVRASRNKWPTLSTTILDRDKDGHMDAATIIIGLLVVLVVGLSIALAVTL